MKEGLHYVPKEDQQGERTQCLVEAKVERMDSIGRREEEMLGSWGA